MKPNALKWIVPAAALLGIMALPMTAQAQPFYHQNEVNARLHNQHQRIEQGLRDRELTRREAGRLTRWDGRIHRQEFRDRRFDDGHLTYGERRRLNNELNRESGVIYRQRQAGR